MKPYLEYALELYRQGGITKAEIARKTKFKFNLPADADQIRKNISHHILKAEHRGLNVECEREGVPTENVSHYWVKTKTHSAFVKVGEEEQRESLLQVIRDIVSNYNPDKVKSINRTKVESPVAIKATVSDMHVGLEPNPHNNSLFAYEYNETIFKQNLDKVFNSLCKEFEAHGKFDLLVIDDLGDR